MTDPPLAVDRIDGVTTLTIRREESANSLSPTLVAALADACVEAAADRSVRCIVLSGTGPMFCTGADLDGLAGDATDEPRLRQLAARLHVAIESLLLARKPVVVGVNGVAAGAGVPLALSGDLVYVADDARFEFAYPRIGLCGDGGATFLLPRLLGLRRAKEFALLDEPLSPSDAVDAGLATAVVPADELQTRVRGVAESLAAGPTRAYGETKLLLTESLQRGLGAQLAAETDVISRLAATADYASGVAAFRDGTDPEFVGR